jgi:hypothetical protein
MRRAKAANYPARLSSRRQCGVLKLNRSASMKTYVLYIHDDRYAVPTLDTITVGGDERARELAGERLASSPHYYAADLWEGDRLVERLEKPAAPGAA